MSGPGVVRPRLTLLGAGDIEYIHEQTLAVLGEIGVRYASRAALDLIRPHMLAGESTSAGCVVIGTVEGDLHDIGKNLVAMMLQGAGFSVVNLGTGVSPAQFVEAAREHGATILGMSALLTTTLPHMAATIAALKEAGLREQVKVMVGGAPVTAAYAEEIGADGYGANAGMAVERAKELVG